VSGPPQRPARHRRIAWEGEHTIARHVRDLEALLDAWGHDRAVLLGHSFGTNLACFVLAHPGRVAGLIQLAGPFLDPWDWALASARALRPVSYAMNAQLNSAKKAALESRVDELRDSLPPGAVIIGGAGDTRPADALRRLGTRLKCEVIIIPGAGHDPWLEAPD
jgi:pimeloyl-ACP methyl ester carboxylesterase